MKTSSRSHLAKYVASTLASRKIKHKELITQIAAWISENKKYREIDYLLNDVKFYLAKEYKYHVFKVSTSRELSQLEKDLILNKIKMQLNSEPVEIIYEIDPDLIGGLVIESPDSVLDLSIKNKLKSFVKNSQAI